MIPFLAHTKNQGEKNRMNFSISVLSNLTCLLTSIMELHFSDSEKRIGGVPSLLKYYIDGGSNLCVDFTKYLAITR